MVIFLFIFGCLMTLVGFKFLLLSVKMFSEFCCNANEVVMEHPEIKKLLTPPTNPYGDTPEGVPLQKYEETLRLGKVVIKNTIIILHALWWTGALCAIGGIIALCFGIKMV